MRRLKHAAIFLFCLCAAAAGVWADDFSFDDFGGTDSTGSAPAGPDISGSVLFASRAGVSEQALGDLGDTDATGDTLTAAPSADLDFAYSTDTADLFVNLKVDPDKLHDDPAALLDEAYFRYYGNSCDLEAGLMKVVWGKGDQLHVVDFLNADDYSDFINPDYLDRRLASPMVKLNFYPTEQGKLELVFLPTLVADEIPLSGTWAPAEARALKAYAANFIDNAGLPDSQLAAYLDGSALYPDTATLDYAQGALRYTDTLGALDWGMSYYYGYLKQPSVTVSFSSPTTVSGIDLAYDRLQAFGLEAGGVFHGFNLRSEAAYYMTGDTTGDDPEVHNNSIRYLAGFDRNLPVSSMNLNLQLTQTVTLRDSEITSPADVDYSRDGNYTATRLVGKLSDSFAHETVKPELKGIYAFEDRDFMAAVKISYLPADDFTVSLEGRLFGGGRDYTDFGQFDANDYVELAFEYKF